MAKKIKFPLEMAEGVQVRTIEELRENFDIEKILEYFIDGRLPIWLNDRYYENEAEMVEKLSKDDIEVNKRLCEIFDVEYQNDNKIDIEDIQRKKQKFDKLKQFTDDVTILNNVDSVAFNQEELADLIDEGETKIYLCDNEFAIPLKIENITYIGVARAIVKIHSNEKINFESKNIKFANVDFDEKYKIIDSKSDSKHLEKINTVLDELINIPKFLMFGQRCPIEFMFNCTYSSKGKAYSAAQSFINSHCNIVSKEFDYNNLESYVYNMISKYDNYVCKKIDVAIEIIEEIKNVSKDSTASTQNIIGKLINYRKIFKNELSSMLWSIVSDNRFYYINREYYYNLIEISDGLSMGGFFGGTEYRIESDKPLDRIHSDYEERQNDFSNLAFGKVKNYTENIINLIRTFKLNLENMSK